MTQQEVGRVAERARMVLLSTRGFTVPEICNIFETTDDTVYSWFNRFGEEGPEGLLDRSRSGRPREIDEEAEAELEQLLERSPQEEGYGFTTWTTPLRRALDRLAFVWRRPRWAIDYRDPDYDERMGAIEAVLEEAAHAEAELTVLFEDETTVRRLPPLRSMWMRRGAQARVRVPETNGKFSLYGVLDPLTGETFTVPYPKGKSRYTKAFLEELMSRFEGQVVLVWDQAKWHTSQMVEQVVDQHERLEVVLLPKRAPEENPVEDLWRHLKRIVAANLERSLDALKEACRAFFSTLSNQDALRMAGLAA